MEEKITLFDFDLQMKNCKKEDLQKKIHIALNVLKHCKENAKIEYTPHVISNPIEESSQLTGVPMETLVTINTLEQKTKTFKNWLSEQNHTIHHQYYNYDYDSLKRLLLESYTKKLEIPTALEGNAAFDGYKNHFTLLQLPGTKSSIVVEKPESVLERRKFIYTKMKYREAKKNIVYIGKVTLLMHQGKLSYKEDNIDAKSRFTIAVSPVFGHIGYIYCCGNSEEYMTNWIEEKIIPELPKESVIIFQENVLNNANKTIDSLSTKEDIINWLKSNKVNHDPKMHRADLHKLINAYKESCVGQLSAVEENLKAHGCIVMRKKNCNLNVNYFDPFWDFLLQKLTEASLPKRITNLRNNTTITTRTMGFIVQNVSLDYWKNLENMLLHKELDIYKEDLEMEHVIDKLLIMMKHESLPKGVKLNDYSKTMEQAPMYLAHSVRDLNMQCKHLNKYT